MFIQRNISIVDTDFTVNEIIEKAKKSRVSINSDIFNFETIDTINTKIAFMNFVEPKVIVDAFKFVLRKFEKSLNSIDAIIIKKDGFNIAVYSKNNCSFINNTIIVELKDKSGEVFNWVVYGSLTCAAIYFLFFNDKKSKK